MVDKNAVALFVMPGFLFHILFVMKKFLRGTVGLSIPESSVDCHDLEWGVTDEGLLWILW